ncbi:MAG: hypothetical protein ACKPDM_01635, partial [Dolichospermum sp.]
MPLFGGTDGMNIREKDPFRNELMEDQKESTCAALYSVKKAIDTVRDPDILDMNMLVVPGITNPIIT